ncbi:MAG: SDR family NAD(P)-dependent oxidoreductase, partial [Pseudomonadota bacterium]
FMSVVDELRHDEIYPELAGHRVLITGVSTTLGVDVSRAFADHATQLVIQTSENSPEMDGLTTLLAQSTTGFQVFEKTLDNGDEAVSFLQGPAQSTFGGLEVVVNLIRINPEDMAGRFALDQIEDLIAEKLVPATMIGRIAANRMRLTMTDGLILNVIAAPRSQSPQEMALVDMLRSTLATITRREAESWSNQGIRINAVGPCSFVDEAVGSDQALGGEPDVAALALYLASERGNKLSGHLFDAKNLGGL